MNLLSVALQNNAAIDVIERLAALQEKITLKDAEIQFDDALSSCQKQLGRISADATNPQTKSGYASYAKLDKIVRPIYTAEGFAISYGEKDCPTPGKTRFVAYLSRAGVTREYVKDLTPSTKGPKGNDVMTPIHADGAADSYAKRYLLKNIFNIAIGEDDTDGNAQPQGLSDEKIKQLGVAIAESTTVESLKKTYFAAYREAEKAKDRDAMNLFISTAKMRKRELGFTEAK
jgi:hypothetical protein